ncbi:MAG: DUF3465 domain-containing protein [Planctomycetota bacterium]
MSASDPQALVGGRSRLAGIVVVAAAAILLAVGRSLGIDPLDGTTTVAAAPSEDVETKVDDTEKIQRLFSGMRSDVIVEAAGEVVHILPTDNRGSRHQLFLVELSSGQTLKLSHNIDIAPTIPLEEGDTVRFRGEYEWNQKGGVVHWTHRNTRGGSHPGGWIDHEGVRYE